MTNAADVESSEQLNPRHVVVWDLQSYTNYSYDAYSIGTVSCNVGICGFATESIHV